MKKVITIVVCSFVLVSATSLFAGTGMKENLLPLKSNELGSYRSLHGKKLFGGSGGDAFKQGKFVMTAGYGFPNLWKAVLVAVVNDSALNVKVIGTGPIHFRAEYAVSDGVGFGVSVNYVSAGVSYTELPYEYKFTRSSLSILARLNFHFGTSENLDPYFGIGAGYKQATFKFSSNDPNYTGESFPGFSPFGFETTIGVRYYFTPGFGIYTELGIAKSVIQGGLSVAF